VARVGPDEWREVNVPFTGVDGRPRYRRIDLVPEPASTAAADRPALMVGRAIEVPR
jgi:hypothetical protein